MITLPSPNLWLQLFCTTLLFIASQQLVAQWSDISHADAAIKFDIPEQSLQGALEHYSVLTGKYLLYDSEILIGRSSEPLQGFFTPHEGLLRLLQGSDLKVEYTAADAFILSREVASQAPVGAESEASLSTTRRQHYALLQRSLTQWFCREEGLRPGAYRAELQLWFDRHGRLQDVDLLSSSGDLARDRLLQTSLPGLQLEQATPSGIEQPLTVVIEPRRLACRV